VAGALRARYGGDPVKIKKNVLFSQLPPEWPQDPLLQIRQQVASSGLKIVVLDDDPTGTQTVYGVPVLTRWAIDELIEELLRPEPLVYLLTNSRSLPLKQAQELNHEIAANLRSASQETGRQFSLVSRSDSTLRGHFPGEVQALLEALNQPCDGILIIPFFLEGGRYTIQDIHYVAEDEYLVPAAETEYAQDATFGYECSNLRQWVSEKYGGKVQPENVISIDIGTLRQLGPKAVAATLQELKDRQVCIVNAASYRDIEVFVAGLLQAEEHGKRFIFRTAASFVRVRGGLAPRGLLTPGELDFSPDRSGGLVIAGSYIQKSSAQIEALSGLPGIVSLEVDVPRLLNQSKREEVIARVARAAENAINTREVALVYTSRTLVRGSDAAASLEVGRLVSSALVEIVRSIDTAPAWVVAKGGITSSDVATHGLDVFRAEVLGQILPGVPVWRTAAESRWPNLVYVVFPGNVGGPQALAEVVRLLNG
jgi:uncharacterized protein YgbK (DUF1537 family)